MIKREINDCRIKVSMLGQSGVCFRFPDCTVYVDPYLSNSVAQLDAPDLQRQVPIEITPAEAFDADWVLITHHHLDHCDPHTIPDMAKASPSMRLMGPQVVLDQLRSWGIDESRLVEAKEGWQSLTDGLRVKAVCAAHPEVARDAAGKLIYVGYLLDLGGRKIYHAGDTSLCEEVICSVTAERPVHTAFLPVNERNFFRERRGIIGNMSVREAFGFAQEIGAKEVVPVHWDMFLANETLVEEIRAIHRRMKPRFNLSIRPQMINLGDARISVIIRTLNEAVHLDRLLSSIAEQKTSGLEHEIIVVDSGSTDGTLEIAEKHGCRVLHITREEFSFGRSLNVGCEAANGDFLVITSGHCVPVDRHWLQHLIQPLVDGVASYSFGRQLGGDDSHFSEKRIFNKYFPAQANNGQKEFFCNNANAALQYSTWEQLRFDEDLTGLEDMELAQRLVINSGRVIYVPEAAVYHYHQESWLQVQRRFEREALALQRIMPQVHVSPFDLVRYILRSVLSDWRAARDERTWFNNAIDIFRYRYHQYVGVYKGNHQHRKLSHTEKEKYFYPE